MLKFRGPLDSGKFESCPPNFRGGILLCLLWWKEALLLIQFHATLLVGPVILGQRDDAGDEFVFRSREPKAVLQSCRE